MAALADLMNSPACLATLMQRDPRQRLIEAIAWLDPQTLIKDAYSDAEFNYDAEDDLTTALYVCRECFPAVYAGARQLQLQGTNEAVLERYLVDGISAQLVVPLNALEEIRYGPPLECYGISLETPDEGADDELMQRLAPLFAAFGLSVGGTEPNSVQENAVAAVRVLVQSVQERSEAIYSDLANLLLWMFSMSGNTAVDWTLEMLWDSGIELPDWSAEDVKLINDINAEARETITSAEHALDTLDEDEALRQALYANIRAVLHFVNRKSKKGKQDHVRTHSAQRANADATTLVKRITWPERT